MEDAFWCHPFQRQEGLWKIGKRCSNVRISSFICVSGSVFATDRGNTYAAFWDVVGVVHDVSGQAKVTDLHKFALTDQHISCSEVSMDALRRDSAEYCFHTWDMLFMHQGQGHGRAVWVHGMLSYLAASFTNCGITESNPHGQWHDYGVLFLPYVLGGEELHPFGHLVAEAQKVVVGQSRRVADDQVHPAPTWAEESPQTPEEEEKAKSVTLRSGLSGGQNYCHPVTSRTETL